MNNFRNARKAVNMTQEEVAQRLGLTRAAYTHYEKGTRECPFDTLRKIAAIFNTSIDYLLGNNLKNTPPPSDILTDFESLTTDGQQMILGMLNLLKITHSAVRG